VQTGELAGVLSLTDGGVYGTIDSRSSASLLARIMFDRSMISLTPAGERSPVK
jgi:hypothetical protein